MDWIAITCWVVLGASGLLALWALFWDRPRGRLRCRKCAYDMSGGGLVCPECGREHKAERSLRRTRRKWKTAVVAILAALLATHTQHQRDLIHYEGMSGLLPPLALAALADPSVIESGIGRYWTGTESKLHTRMMMSCSSPIADGIWMQKIAKYMQSTSGNADHFVDIYDISDIISEREIFPPGRSYKQAVRDGRATVIGEIRRLHSEAIVATVLARLNVSEYAVGKDSEVECYVDSGRVVLRADGRVHEHFASSLDAIRARSWTVGRSDLPAVSTTACYVLYRIDIDDKSLSTPWNASDEMYMHIQHWILPGAFDPAYEPSRVALVSNGFVVWADSEDHIEIIEYLQSFSSLR